MPKEKLWDFSIITQWLGVGLGLLIVDGLQQPNNEENTLGFWMGFLPFMGRTSLVLLN